MRLRRQGELERWQGLLEERGLKATATRRAVLAAFLEADGHVTLADVQTLVRRGERPVGLATIYRTMKILEAAGLARRHVFDGEASRYEVATGAGHHGHFICEACGGIQEFESPDLERLEVAIARARGFEIQRRRHELYGACRRCQGINPTSTRA